MLPLHDTYHWEFGFAAGAAGVLMATDGMLEKFADWEPGAYGAPIDWNREAIDLFGGMRYRRGRRAGALRRCGRLSACAACDLRG
ncbi:MAG: hypothetical protein ACLU7D_11350 [Collinsella sp.]